MHVHLREDVIAGAVENSRDFVEPIARQAFLNADDRRNSSGDGSAELDAARHFSREREQLGTVLGDQDFIRGYHGFPVGEGLANPVTGGRDASDQFHHHVHIGGEHFVRAIRPANVRGQAADFFLGDVAIADVRQQQRTVWVAAEDFGHGPAHGAEPDQPDFQFRARSGGRFRRRVAFAAPVLFT